MRTGNQKSGLSLFELLIALALLAFISLALSSGFRLGSRLFVKSAELAAVSDELALRARLRDWLATATPPSLLTGFANGFKGQNHSMEFITLTQTPFAPKAAGLSVSVWAEHDELLLKAIAFDDDGKTLLEYSGLLATNVSDVRFDYYLASGETAGWQTEWSETARLPDLVRISTGRGSQPDWPEFTVRLLMVQ